MFNDNSLFTLFRIFNRLTYDSNKLHKEEVQLFLQNVMKAIGNEWSSEPLEDFTNEELLNFWDVVECLETQYLLETPEM